MNVKKLEQKVEVYLTAEYIWQPVNIISTISAICLTRLLNFYKCLLLLWRQPGQVKRGDLRIIFKDNPRSAFFWLLTNKEVQFLTGPLVPDYHATLFFIWYQWIFFTLSLTEGNQIWTQSNSWDLLIFYFCKTANCFGSPEVTHLSRNLLDIFWAS